MRKFLLSFITQKLTQSFRLTLPDLYQVLKCYARFKSRGRQFQKEENNHNVIFDIKATMKKKKMKYGRKIVATRKPEK